ncbi:6462_t:CDS:2 [Paraglomus brasilianum]|uniref:6462_t:CDS:1 n=1 Tax=Paraglomus brasilianum TaxID=144538 RepID=A0A9N8YW48_9GLOM|nr:6462_t:CDS:2 [Paraglomus brasilianum]
MSELNPKTESVEEIKHDTSEEPVYGKFDPNTKDADLEKFAQKLGIEESQYGPLTDKDREKFYEGEELAKNLIAYRRFTEARQFDSSQGSHVMIIDGKIVRYGPELPDEEYDEKSRSVVRASY